MGSILNQLFASVARSSRCLAPRATACRPLHASAWHRGRELYHDEDATDLLVANGDRGDHMILAQLERYANYPPTPVSIQHFIQFGQSKEIDESFLFLRRELPIRLANIMKELQFLPKVLRKTRGCAEITQMYLQSFKDLLAFEKLNEKDEATLSDFTRCLTSIRNRHDHVVKVMASAALSVKERYSSDIRLPKFEKNIQYFLDRLYTSRISVRMLINQHTLLYCTSPSQQPVKPNKSVVGSIDLECKVLPIVRDAYNDARFLSEQYYMASPELSVRAFDMSADKVPIRPLETSPLHKLFHGGAGVPVDSLLQPEIGAQVDDVQCIYVPSHMHHVLFELFKNAMRATIEFCNGGDDDDMPPIDVLIVKTAEDVTIRVSDRGGGIAKRHQKNVFEYMYTTAPRALNTSSSGVSPAELRQRMTPEQHELDGQMSIPLAGYGYGLPLSRLYARYLAGDLELYSVHGFGTDAVLHLQALPEEARERLPVFNPTGSRKIYEANLTADDWTDY